MIGQMLGPYRVLEKLGEGGMGEVYKARDTRLGRDVAIKVLLKEYAADADPSAGSGSSRARSRDDRLRRFEQEARAASALNHPNILTVFDVGAHEGAPYLVTELLEGESLRDRLKDGALPARKVLELAVQVASGLAAAHDKGIVHRDLKPENLFVSADGHVKILDFGLAKLRPTPQEATAAPTLADSTQPGVVMGTVAYMSPEQARGQTLDHRSDIFSFGAVMYEMVTGKRVFARGTAADTISAILKEDPTEPTTIEPATPPPLSRAILHCLEKRPEDRFQSARDLAFDLEGMTGTGAAPAVVSGRGPLTGRRRSAVALTGVAVAAILLAAGFFVVGRLTAVRPGPPTFTCLTFQRGRIETARFTADGKSVLYGAAWDGRLPDIFETRTDRSSTRSLDKRGDRLHAVSRTGELALEKAAASDLQEYGTAHGPLAVCALFGGAPRDLVEDVSAADWAPDGTTLAVVRRIGGEDRLEMPPGHVLVRTSGWLRNIRVSPDGRRIAFIEHPQFHDSRGCVAVADATGRKTMLTEEYGSVQGAAWSPDGREIWFSAVALGMRQSLFAVTPEGRLRTVAQFPTSVTVHDLGQDGRVLLASQRAQTGIRGSSSEDNKERELGWLDSPWPAALSADGRMLLLDDAGETAGPHYRVYLRPMDGSDPVNLGAGAGCALSPDGRWALAVHHGPPQRLELIPTGPGDVLFPPRGQVETYQVAGSFLPDGRRIVFVGAERGHPQRTWIQELPGGMPRPVTPEGTAGVTTSPDGRWVAALDQALTLTLFPLQGGEPRTVATLARDQEVVQWSADGRTLFVSQLYRGPRLDVFGIDTESGKRRLWKPFEVPDPAGVGVATFVVTRDARSYAYVYERLLDELYLVDGLK